MMEYGVFKKVVAARIKEFLPPVFGSFDVEICDVPKTNGTKEALVMSLRGGDISISAPNVYMEDLYREFCLIEDLETVIEDAAMFILNFTGRIGGQNMKATPDELKTSIVPVLVNTECNKEILEMQTSYEWLDLSITYRVVAKMDEEFGYASAILTKEFQADLELTDEELVELAEINRAELLPADVVSVGEGVSVITSDKVLFGAYNMTRPDVLEQIAENMQDDLYLMPSSIHEVLAIKAGDVDKTSLKGLLAKGERKGREDDEFLSDNVYYYSRKNKSVEILEL